MLLHKLFRTTQKKKKRGMTRIIRNDRIHIFSAKLQYPKTVGKNLRNRILASRWI